MVHCASTRHPAAIVDDLHCKVLREAVQNSKTSFSENVRALLNCKRLGKGEYKSFHVFCRLSFIQSNPVFLFPIKFQCYSWGLLLVRDNYYNQLAFVNQHTYIPNQMNFLLKTLLQVAVQLSSQAVQM